jgi:hypothetical protein
MTQAGPQAGEERAHPRRGGVKNTDLGSRTVAATAQASASALTPAWRCCPPLRSYQGRLLA